MTASFLAAFVINRHVAPNDVPKQASVAHSIDKLRDVSEPAMLCDFPSRARWKTILESGPKDARENLLLLGPRALPELLDHLRDLTPTRLEPAHSAYRALYYDPSQRQARAKAGWQIRTRNTWSFAPRVGDVCASLISQITDRDNCPVTMGAGTDRSVVRSPVEEEQIAAAFRADWGDNPAQKLERQFRSNSLTMPVDPSALLRLSIYYPDAAVSCLNQILKLRLYWRDSYFSAVTAYYEHRSIGGWRRTIAVLTNNKDVRQSASYEILQEFARQKDLRFASTVVDGWRMLQVAGLPPPRINQPARSIAVRVLADCISASVLIKSETLDKHLIQLLQRVCGSAMGRKYPFETLSVGEALWTRFEGSTKRRSVSATIEAFLKKLGGEGDTVSGAKSHWKDVIGAHVVILEPARPWLPGKPGVSD